MGLQLDSTNPGEKHLVPQSTQQLMSHFQDVMVFSKKMKNIICAKFNPINPMVVGDSTPSQVLGLNPKID